MRKVNIQIAVVFAALIEADVAIRILDIIVAGAGIQQPADIHTQVAVALGGVFFLQAGVIQDCLLPAATVVPSSMVVSWV